MSGALSRPILRAAGLLSILLSTVYTTHSYADSPLFPPFDVGAVRDKAGVVDKKAFSCERPPEAQKDLHMESFYEKEDSSSSTVDPEAYAAYKKASKPASIFEIRLASMANRYVRSSPPRQDVAACDLDWLVAWADGDALLGDVNKNGEYTRKWLLGSIASTWLQIRDEPTLDPEKKQRVISWIRKVATAVKSDFSRDGHLKSRQNNHMDWAAWGVGAAGIAINDRAMFDWGVEKARKGIDDIQPDGTLPLELARGKRAYLYHLFAAMPLFMMANAAEKNGIDLFRENDKALQRLGELCLKNLDHPDTFQQMTGQEQDLTHVGTASDLGWVEIYRQHYDDPRADAALEAFRPMKQSRFGGNITLLYSGVFVKNGTKN